MVTSFVHDLRFALRTLIRNPAFSAIAVITLALGIGAPSAVFNLIQGVLLRPPPYASPDRIVLLLPPASMAGLTPEMLPRANGWSGKKKRRRSSVVAAYFWNFKFLIREDGSESIKGMHVTQDYFRVVGIKPWLGREFLPSDYPAPGSNTFQSRKETAIILGYELWQRRFKGDPNILGKTIRVSRHEAALTVVGVMKPGVRFLPTPSELHEPNYDVNAPVDYWAPATPDESKPKAAFWTVAGRLRDGASAAQAQAQLSALAARQAKAEPDFEGITAKAQPLIAELNREARRLLLPLFGAVALVFLIACANVTGLLLARGLQRQQEYAVRCALGAGRARLFGQVLTETLLLAGVGALLGAGLAFATVKLLKVAGGFAIPRLDAVTVSWPVLGFGLGCSILATILAGLVPAWRAAQLDPAHALKTTGPNVSASLTDRRLLRGAAAFQTALSLALLTGAGLLVRTVDNLAKVVSGYSTENILTLNVTEVRNNWMDFHGQALERISALPAVKSAAFAWGVPLTGNKWTSTVEIDGHDRTTKLAGRITLPTRSVTPDYFDTVGCRIIAGRAFRSTDAWRKDEDVTNLPPAIIINEAMAERYFPNAHPIGKKIRFPGARHLSGEVVGVVANARNESLTLAPEPEIYRCFWQFGPFSKHLLVRTPGNPRSLAGVIQRELRAIDPTVSIEKIQTFDQIRSASIAPQTFALRLLMGFSAVAFGLALVGIYGVLSLSVSSRKREMAIRAAIGAQRRHILRLVLGEGARLIGLGLLIGVGAAIALARLLGAFLFGVKPVDPLTLVASILLFVLVSLLACWIPARRATRVDPWRVLRYE